VRSGKFRGWKQALGLAVVTVSMIVMFSLPRVLFVPASLASTSIMIAVSLVSSDYIGLFAPRPRTIVLGLALALVLYLIFVGGNALVKSTSPLGVNASDETSIYSLFESTPLTLKLLVFLLDAVGFESYFRGVLQRLFTPTLGVASAFVVAGLDALIHLSSLNPLFVVTTFISDSVWGLNFYYAKDLSSNILNHFLWDALVFIAFPIT
jgi:membrane protease YdiL (CAAX protease family)